MFFTQEITLRYDSQDPNFYEVFIKKPDRDFKLKLLPGKKGEPQGEPVWTCEIREGQWLLNKLLQKMK